MSNVLYEYEDQLTGVQGKFDNLPITSGTQKELDFWYKTTEDQEKAYPKLKVYWDYINFGDNWTPSGTPWSSAFVSYILRGHNFPKQGAHRNYIKEIMEKKDGTWAAFSIPKTENLKLEVGNVLIKPRTQDFYATHGDVVYKIEQNKAYLVGGNVSNTAKIVKIIDVDSDGRITKPLSKYLIVLKKKSSGMKNLWWLSLLALGGLALVVRK